MYTEGSRIEIEANSTVYSGNSNGKHLSYISIPSFMPTNAPATHGVPIM